MLYWVSILDATIILISNIPTSLIIYKELTSTDNDMADR